MAVVDMMVAAMAVIQQVAAVGLAVMASQHLIFLQEQEVLGW
jgi:hypothetical protein